MINIPYVHVVKIGVTKNVSDRRKNISSTTPGFVFPIFFVFIPFNQDLEKSLHRVFKHFNLPFDRGANGFSEWFWLPVAPFAAMVMIVHQLFWILFSLGLFFGAMWVFQGCPQDVVKALTRLFF